MRSVFTIVALPLLLLFILDGSLPPLLPVISVKAFPAAATSPLANTTSYNENATDTGVLIAAGEVTEYPVFISVTEETQPSPETVESEVVTETYMIIEDQEVDDDDDDDNNSDTSDSSTKSPSTIVRSTTPMQSPKSSPEQEEVLRELKKLWDLSEGMNDTGDDALKSSLSSIVHLAYARVYIEPDETLLKLKYLLQQLQERILLGKNLDPLDVTNTTTQTPAITVTTAGVKSNKTRGEPRTREKRSFYDGYDDEVDAIFFANVNSGENSVIPEEKDHYHVQSFQDDLSEPMKIKPNLSRNNNVIHITQIKNDSINTKNDEDMDRTLLSLGTISTSSVMSMSTTAPSSVVQKIIHINDRQKPMPSFYLTPERIKELKSRVTSSTTTTSTLSPISIVIQDDLENEVNLLQQQQHVDNYDIHISSAETLVPLTTATPSTSSFHKKPSSGESTIVSSPPSTTTTESPFTAEDIALALFHLLRPETFEEDESVNESVTTHPHPKPSNILYQVGSLSSVLNFTINTTNATTTTTTEKPIKIQTTIVPTSSTIVSDNLNTTLSFLKLKEKYTVKKKNNATLLVPRPPALSDLGFATSTSSSTSTERQNSPQNIINNVYDYTTDVLDQKPADQTSITTTIVQDTQQGFQQMVNALSRLSVGAKMVLLFSVSISVLSIGFGMYALGPPLAGVGVLGIIIPIGLLLLFETSASGKRKMTTRQQEQLFISKLQSEEFSKILDMIFNAVIKYNEG